MKKNIRVLWVLANFGAGGVETWLQAIAPHFSKSKAEIYILLTGKNASSDNFHLNFKVFCIEYNKRNIIGFTVGLAKLLIRLQIDLVHDHSGIEGVSKYMLLRKLYCKRVILHFHATPYALKTYYIKASIARMVMLRFNRFIVNVLKMPQLYTSFHAQDEFGLKKHELSDCIYCAVRDDFWRNREQVGPSAPRAELYFVGRLDEHVNQGAWNNNKNSGFFLRICRLLEQRGIHFKAHIIGGGDSTRFTRHLEYAKEIGVDSLIKFYGIVEDPWRVIEPDGILLFPSLHEGFGLVSVEFQILGLHVIQSDHISHETIISNGVRVLPIDQGEEVWEQGILDIISSGHVCTLKEEIAKKFSSEFSFNSLISFYERVYVNT